MREYLRVANSLPTWVPSSWRAHDLIKSATLDNTPYTSIDETKINLLKIDALQLKPKPPKNPQNNRNLNVNAKQESSKQEALHKSLDA